MIASPDLLIPGFERHLRILQGLTPASVASYSAKIAEFISWFENYAAAASAPIHNQHSHGLYEDHRAGQRRT